MAIDYSTAKSYLDAGLSVLPAIKAQKRPNLNSWDLYKKQLPTNKDLQLWFGSACSGICIVCGEVSGNLEIIAGSLIGKHAQSQNIVYKI